MSSISPNSTFVRPATLADATPIATLQTRCIHETLVSELQSPISPATYANLAVPAFIRTWEDTLKNLASDHLVLVALGNNEIQGLLSAAPTDPLSLPENHPAFRSTQSVTHAFEITALEIAAQHLEKGHDARLLAALTDLLLAPLDANACLELYLWVFPSSIFLIQTLNQVGFAPCGIQRTFTIEGKTITQHLWWTSLQSTPSSVS